MIARVFILCFIVGCAIAMGMTGCSENDMSSNSAAEHNTPEMTTTRTLGGTEWPWVVIESKGSAPDEILIIYAYYSENVPAVAVEVRDPEMIEALVTITAGNLSYGSNMPKITDPNIVAAVENYLFPEKSRAVMTWSLIKWCAVHPNDPICIPKPKDEG